MTDRFVSLLAIGLPVFLASVASVALVRRVATAKSWVAKARVDRWHSRPTALHGGVGFFVPFFVAAIGCSRYFAVAAPAYGTASVRLLTIGYFIGVALSAISGLLDDIYVFRPATKLLLQIVATVAFMACGGIAHVTSSQTANILITVFWFIGLVNAVNLLDNMDGVSSGVVMIGTLGVIIIGVMSSSVALPLSSWIGVCLLSALLGFWVFNRPPASIFMGDSGSLFIGFAFAGVTIPTPLNDEFGLSALQNGIPPSVLIAITLAAIPIVDTSLVTFTRLWRGQSPAVGGRDHSTHRLARTGLTARQTMWTIYLLAAAAVGLAILMQRMPQLAGFLFAVLAGGLLLVALYLSTVVIETQAHGSVHWHQLANAIVYRGAVIKMICDVPVVTVAYCFAYLLRYDFEVSGVTVPAMNFGIIVAIGAAMLSNIFLGIHKISWRSSSLADIIYYLAYAVSTAVMIIAALALLTRFDEGHSRGAIAIFSVLFFIGIVGIRFSFRFFDEVLLKVRRLQPPLARRDRTVVLIFGTTKLSRLLCAYIADSPKYTGYEIVGFLDTQLGASGEKFAGLPVYSAETAVLTCFGDSRKEVWVPPAVDWAAAEAFRRRAAGSWGVRTVDLSLHDFAEITEVSTIA